MRQRDKAILDDLQRFRCMSRDDIIDLHFTHLKNPVSSANMVLKRLRRDGYIEVSTDQQPYVYFPSPATVKKDSTKIPHFLEIVRFYRQLVKHSKPKQFIVEPKYGKQFMEPDIFMIWKGAPFFVEIQRSVYSSKVMATKLKRYEAYARSGEWQKEPWQPEKKKVFPYIWIIANHKYNIESGPLRVFQTENVREFLNIVA